MNTPKWLGILRHIVTFGAGMAVTAGDIDPQRVETIAGGILGLAATIWSVYAPEKQTNT